MKESMAKDKARISWLKEGDRNTAFVHASITVRRKQNTTTLQCDDGIVTTDNSIIGSAALDYYQRLFNQYTAPPHCSRMEVIHPIVSDTMNDMLTGIPDIK